MSNLLNIFSGTQAPDVTLREQGWVPVTEERQPYYYDLLTRPSVRQAVQAAGFQLVATPVFTLRGWVYHVKTRLCGEGKATDRPENFEFTAEHTEKLIALLRQMKSTHVHSVIIHRCELWGYVPPTVFMGVRSASVLPVA